MALTMDEALENPETLYLFKEWLRASRAEEYLTAYMQLHKIYRLAPTQRASEMHKFWRNFLSNGAERQKIETEEDYSIYRSHFEEDSVVNSLMVEVSLLLHGHWVNFSPSPVRRRLIGTKINRTGSRLSHQRKVQIAKQNKRADSDEYLIDYVTHHGLQITTATS